MTQAASGNGAGIKRSSSATFCTWEIPDKGVKVDLHLSTVEWVDFEMKKALRFPAHGRRGFRLAARTNGARCFSEYHY